MNRYSKMADAAKASTVPEELDIIRADKVKLEKIDWLWPGRFALGKLGLLAGMPERGKGLIFTDMISRITRAAPWPCNEGRAPIGDCVLIQHEDDPGDTVVPRLIAAGADLKRIHILKMVKKVDDSGKRIFSLADLPMLEKVLESLNDPQFVAIDPLGSYTGKINAAAGNEVRSTLIPLIEMLKRFHVSGIGILHFNKKVDVDNPVLRVADSIAFTAMSRHTFVVTDEPENDRCLLIKGKNNLAPDTKALSFHIEINHGGYDHRDGDEIKAPRVIWEHEHVEISAVQAMQAENSGAAAHNPRKEAKEFILQLLADNGPTAADDLDKTAKAEGISNATLRRARDQLKKEGKIKRVKDGLTGPWIWKLTDGEKDNVKEF
jgi:putative DNA primase/helicase